MGALVRNCAGNESLPQRLVGQYPLARIAFDFPIYAAAFVRATRQVQTS